MLKDVRKKSTVRRIPTPYITQSDVILMLYLLVVRLAS